MTRAYDVRNSAPFVPPPPQASEWRCFPDHVCWPDLDAGRLVRLFPGWHAQEGIVHLVFTTRRGLPPAVRAFMDHLAATFQSGVLAPRE
jgi:DNA-binding transcriptional LysR family regulator